MAFTEQEVSELFGKTVAAASGSNYGTTKAVAQYAATAATIGGPVGATVGAVGTGLAGLYDTLKSVFVSPSPTWEQTNTVAVQMATETTQKIITGVGSDKSAKIVALYAEKLKSYIQSSPHNNTQTANFIEAINREVIGGNVRADAFPFSNLDDLRLCWCVWLHIHWLYGGVSKNEITSGAALTKLQASMTSTLEAAIYEGSGIKLQPQVNQTTGEKTIQPPTTLASKFSGQYMPILLVGAAVGLLYFVTKGGK